MFADEPVNAKVSTTSSLLIPLALSWLLAVWNCALLVGDFRHGSSGWWGSGVANLWLPGGLLASLAAILVCIGVILRARVRGAVFLSALVLTVLAAVTICACAVGVLVATAFGTVFL